MLASTRRLAGLCATSRAMSHPDYDTLRQPGPSWVSLATIRLRPALCGLLGPLRASVATKAALGDYAAPTVLIWSSFERQPLSENKR